MSSEFLTTKEVALALGLSESFVRDRCLRGEIEAMKFGRAWRVSLGSVRSYLNKSRWIPVSAMVVRDTGHNEAVARFARARRETA